MSAYGAYSIFIAGFWLAMLIPPQAAGLQALVAAVLLTMIWGGSVQNGSDWIWYEEDFRLITESGSLVDAMAASTFEPGFVALTYLCGLLGFNFQDFVLACGALNSAAWVYFSRNALPSGNVALSALLVFLVNGWTLYNEQLRQALAISSLLVAYISWSRTAWLASLSWFLIAMLLHRSAVAFVVVLALQRYVAKQTESWCSIRLIAGVAAGILLAIGGLVIVVSSGILSVFQGNVLADKLVSYGEDEMYGRPIFSLGMISNLLGLAAVCYGYRTVRDCADDRIKFYWFMSLCWCVVSPLLRIQLIFTRFEHYLLPFVPILLSYLWLARTSLWDTLMMRAIILVFALSFVGRIFLQPNQAVWVADYQNVLLGTVFGMPEADRDDRKTEICENLRQNDNPFCDWR